MGITPTRVTKRIREIVDCISDVLSAYNTQTSITLGQLEVGEKTNELPVMLELLPLLEIGGRIITADAMHCQKTVQHEPSDSRSGHPAGHYLRYIQISKPAKALIIFVNTVISAAIPFWLSVRLNI